MNITYHPMTEAPDTISGGFNVTQRLFSVSKKGALTLLARMALTFATNNAGI